MTCCFAAASRIPAAFLITTVVSIAAAGDRVGRFPSRRIRIRRERLVSAIHPRVRPPSAWRALALFILYGSSGPWAGDASRAEALPGISLPDIAQNVLLYIPFGMFGVWALRGSRLSRTAHVPVARRARARLQRGDGAAADAAWRRASPPRSTSIANVAGTARRRRSRRSRSNKRWRCAADSGSPHRPAEHARQIRCWPRFSRSSWWRRGIRSTSRWTSAP